MYTSSVITAVVAGLLSTATAAPLTARSNSSYYSSNSTTTSAPSTSTGSYNGPIATVFPDYTSQYNSKTGAVDFHTSRGLVSRSPSNSGADISTLVTFTLDSQYASNQCQLVFDLEDPTSYVSGSGKAQLFTSLAPANADSSTWPSGNLRNQDLGTIDIYPGGRAQFEVGSGPGATTNGVFPCSAITGQIYGGEVVPQGDSDTISWPAGQDGPKIIVWSTRLGFGNDLK